MLIVRSDIRLRATSETNTAGDASSDSLSDVESSVTDADFVSLDSSDGLAPDPDLVTATAELHEASEDDEEFWTPDSAPERSTSPAWQAELASTVADHPVESEPSEPDTEAEPADDGHLGDTANLPDEWEVDLGGDAETNSDEDSPPKRQPDARLVPSTEHVRRRTGQNARRVPPIAVRSSTRDEDSVKSLDGS